jgi:ribonuclease R
MTFDEERTRPARLLSGRIKVHPDGYGFVVPDDRSEDIHVSARSRGTAMDSDRVEVDWWVGPRGLEGRVIRVLERGRGKITGQLVASGKAGFRFEPDDPRITGPVALTGTLNGARPGVAVVAEIVHYPEHLHEALQVSVLKILGDPDDPRTEIEKILAIADITEEFPPEVAAFAAAVPTTVQPGDLRDRADLRHVPFTTIDPETARDFDDAVALEPLPDGGLRLWVAVADVSHYVREGQPIDVEAEQRGCSVYLPNRAIPMLPEQLSGHICSLVPEQDRLAMVVRIDYDTHDNVRATDFCAAVIHSRARLDYPGVAAALAGNTKGKRKKYEPFLPSLRAMDTFAKRLRARRFARGALELDLPEVVVELDRDDPALVREVRRARKDPGERQAYAMIEEFMLAANEAVGSSFEERGEESIWRVHDAPDAEKLETFAALAEKYAIQVDVDEARTPRGLARVLAMMKGHSAEKALSFQLLRSLKQATYDTVNIGHFGLASEAYLHFTSPIRRYPDLVAHRLLKRRLAREGKPSGGFSSREVGPPPEPQEIQRAATDASFSERKAMEVERGVVDLYRAFFLRDRVGDVFDGSISGVASFGVFVTIDDPFVEGLVRVEYLQPDDYYVFDEVAFRMVGRRTGRAFVLGDRVRVEVLSVSVARRKVDFRLERHEPQQLETPGGERRGRRRSEKKSRLYEVETARRERAEPRRTAEPEPRRAREPERAGKRERARGKEKERPAKRATRAFGKPRKASGAGRPKTARTGGRKKPRR